MIGNAVTLRSGDSGTWFWRDENFVVGMGIGTENGDAMILPMSDVIAAAMEIVMSGSVDEVPELAIQVNL